RNWESSLLDFSNFDLVFGHFPIERYRGNPNQYHYVTLMRDPIERIVSHYFYAKNRPQENVDQRKLKNSYQKEISLDEMDIVDFAKFKDVKIMYQKYLNNFQPSDFQLVGFTDHYDQFLLKLRDLLEIEVDTSMHARKGTKQAITPKQERQLQRILKDSVEYYEDFRRYWLP
ncbi:MAG: hypothetical protein AAF902_17650, partial [Chloroflexota bacterium]